MPITHTDAPVIGLPEGGKVAGGIAFGLEELAAVFAATNLALAHINDNVDDYNDATGRAYATALVSVFRKLVEFKDGRALSRPANTLAI